MCLFTQPFTDTILFLCCDIVSLVVQGVGGGIAAIAVNMRHNPARGGHIMLGGIVFQMVTILAYAVCAGEFLLRFSQDRPARHLLGPGAAPSQARGVLTPKMRLLLGALVFNTTCLFIRAVYRVIELSDGWTGRIIQTQVYFNVLDGAMITLAIITLNVGHPGALLGLRHAPQKTVMEKDADGSEEVLETEKALARG